MFCSKSFYTTCSTCLLSSLSKSCSFQWSIYIQITYTYFYKFLRLIKNIDEEVISFWRVHDKNIKKFYLDKRHDQDIIISASPEFLLKPIANKLKVKDLIGSRVDKHTGKTTGLNCHDVEKVRRLDEKYEDYKVIEAYSDSIKSDKPILDLAKRAYLVKKDNISIIK